MLRVGLTGGLGSGKSTVARMLADKGAYILESDTLARELMMARGAGLLDAIIATFGDRVLRADGTLDRAMLAGFAFTEGRVEELNAIVHPAVLATQEMKIEDIAARDASAVVVVESALIFETKYEQEDGWRSRFDRIILVTAPEYLRIERFVERTTGTSTDREAQEREARMRMKFQLSDAQKAARSDFILKNDSTLAELQAKVDVLWSALAECAGNRS